MKSTRWQRRAGGCFAALIIAGCAQKGPPPLYLWEEFPRQQYETLLSNGAGSPEQILELEAHGEKARASGTALPPGFRAHLGMLKLSVGDVDRARELWEGEKSAFPESAPYMDRLLRQLQPNAPKEKAL